jgi:hypothetical protein
MEPFLGAIKNATLTLLLISSALFLFALSPNDYDALKDSFNEASALSALGKYDLTTRGQTVEALTEENTQEDVSGFQAALQSAFRKFSTWNTKSMVVSVPVALQGIPKDATVQQLYDALSYKPHLVFFHTSSWTESYTSRQTWKTATTLDAFLRSLINKAHCVLDLRVVVTCRDISRQASIDALVLTPRWKPNTFVDVTFPARALPLSAPGSSPEDVKQPLTDGVGLPSTSGYEVLLPISLATPTLGKRLGRFIRGYVRDGPGDEVLNIKWSLGPRSWWLIWPASQSYWPIWHADEGRLIDWMGSAGTGSHASSVLANESAIDFLSGLRYQPDWENISSESPEKVSSDFESRLNSAGRASVSLFGMAVDQRIVLFAGPIAVLIASLYLLSLLRMFIISLDRSQLPKTSLKAYPWIGLFRDSLSNALSSGLVVLPPVASALLVIKYHAWDPATVVAIILTIILIFVCVEIDRAVLKLRRLFAAAVLSPALGDNDE